MHERLHAGGAAVDSAIGGYFELELPTVRTLIYPTALRFQSARAAFLALLLAGKPKRVWLPYYLCSTMLASLKHAGVEAAFYRIDSDFLLEQHIELEDGDWLFYVNYFGICGAQVDALLARFDPRRVIIDCSQALFARPHDCLATLYSPRKFLGVPDGGLLLTSVPVDPPQSADNGTFDRMLPLLKRMAFSPEAGYEEHQRAERALFDQMPMRMSNLTLRLLSSVDYENVRISRNRNFSFLHAHLGQHNRLRIDPARVDGPLCYPLLIGNAGLREALIRKRVFVPTYWRDVLDVVDASSCEASFVNGLVALPCDQRYGEAEMTRIVNFCTEFFAAVDEDQALTLSNIAQ